MSRSRFDFTKPEDDEQLSIPIPPQKPEVQAKVAQASEIHELLDRIWANAERLLGARSAQIKALVTEVRRKV